MTREREKIITLVWLACIIITVSVLTVITWINSRTVRAASSTEVSNNTATYSTLPTMSAAEMQAKIDSNRKSASNSEAGEYGIFAFIPLDEELQKYTLQTAYKYELNVMLVYAVMYYASSFDIDACSVYDSSVCYGLMQISSAHQEELDAIGLSDYATNPRSNIEAGCYLLNKYRNAAESGNYFTYMLMAYNEGLSKTNVNWKSGICESDYTTKVINKMQEYTFRSINRN